jgi:hypothetical protein
LHAARKRRRGMPRASAGVPLLQGFRVDYQSGDHHLWAMSVDARSDIARDRHRLDHRDAICVTYMDDPEGGVFVQGPPDAFSFRAEYFNETRPGVIAQSLRGSCEGGECTIALRPPSGGYVFVLIGFDMRFAGGIGSPPHHDLNYDKNEDDAYAFAVTYAWAPSEYVRNLTTISGTKPAASPSSRRIAYR